MEDKKITAPLCWMADRLPSGALDTSKQIFAFLYEDLCERVCPGIVETATGSVKSEITLFDYCRTETKEILLYRWVQTVETIGQAYPKVATRYSAAIFEKNALKDIVPLYALKGQAVAWWIARKISPIAKLQSKEWI